MNGAMKHALVIMLAVIALAAIAPGLSAPPAGAAPADDAPRDGAAETAVDAHGEAEEQGTLRMTADERRANGVVTAPVARRSLAKEISVPGEVVLDLYRSTQITPRIAAQVVARHARLGDEVKEGQRLVTLSSVEMARAQGDLIVTNREWRRVRKLGREVVSERRYVETQVAAQQAKAKVLAFGMTAEQVATLLKVGDVSKAAGTFDLLAPQSGTIVNDDFIVGELAEPGRLLFRISDETRVWIEAQLAPEQAAHIAIGAPARVLVDGSHRMDGRVIQVYHTLDETTRTLPVRIEVENAGDELHPGQFVNAEIQAGQSEPVLAVPREAIILMDGTPTVFKVEGDALHPTPIDAGGERGGWVEIAGGLAAGDEIAVSEVFLLKSLILKSKMGEGDGH